MISFSPLVAANLVEDRYRFLDNLLALEAVSNQGLSPDPQPQVAGFLPLQEWEPFLSLLPDRIWAGYLRRGISHGFRIGVPPSPALRAVGSNSLSALSRAPAVDRYILEELRAGTLVLSPTEGNHTSPIAFIPKRNRPGKYRLIVNLSAPEGASVNDNISQTHSSFHYTTVRDVAELIPTGWFMAKLDLKSAYRKVPVHPTDSHLLAISWCDMVFLDRALPFGLRSAPIIFTAVADGLAWAMICSGLVHLAHYLDDFILWAPDAESCATQLSLAVNLAGRLGLPVEPSKVEGPSTVLTFLGIEIDSMARELRLPRDKMLRLRGVVSNQWGNSRVSATKHQLDILVGLLSDAAKVVPAGRPFIRSLIDAKSSLKDLSHFTRLSPGCKADIEWWAAFIEGWNGTGIFPSEVSGPSITADASGSWGCGAFLSRGHLWFQFQWPISWSPVNIAAKELFPIVVAVAIWGPLFRESCILIYSDNAAVICALASRSAKDKHLSHLLRCLFFFLAQYNVSYSAQHLAGDRNGAADALSRDNLPLFLSLFPQAPRTPSSVPEPLLSMLLDKGLIWTSARWRELFRASLAAV